jgi:hypothetical protein
MLDPCRVLAVEQFKQRLREQRRDIRLKLINLPPTGVAVSFVILIVDVRSPTFAAGLLVSSTPNASLNRGAKLLAASPPAANVPNEVSQSRRLVMVLSARKSNCVVATTHTASDFP